MNALFNDKRVLILLTALSATIVLSGCSNSEQRACIDSKSYLWDNSDNPPHKNKAYWDAVKQCKEKYP